MGSARSAARGIGVITEATVSRTAAARKLRVISCLMLPPESLVSAALNRQDVMLTMIAVACFIHLKRWRQLQAAAGCPGGRASQKQIDPVRDMNAMIVNAIW